MPHRRTRFDRYLFAAVALAVSSTAGAQTVVEDTVSIAGRRVVVWRPEASALALRPVVFFSHGLGGCPTQSRFLTRGLAERGYWVLAPFHRDAGCGNTTAASRALARPPVPFDQPARWNDASFQNRTDDVSAVIDALAAPPWAGRIDLDRVAVAGHSLGGYTAMGLAGGWTSQRAPRVRAVLAMAPYADPFLVHGTLGGLSVPIMYQGAALDDGITRSLRKRGGVYDRTPGPKYFVEFARARHSSWGNRPNAAHEAMLAYATAFLDEYVRKAGASELLTRKLSGVSALRFDARTAAGEPTGR
jgi:predicted dienelactone hydrolase